MPISIFDIIVGGLLIWGIVKGFQNGFIIELSSLAALVIGILGAMFLSNHADAWVRQWCDFEYTGIIVFLLIFIGIIIGMNLLAVALTKVIEITALNLVNRLLGAIFSVTVFAFIISVFVSIMTFFQWDTKLIPDKEKEKSYLYQPITNFAPSIFPYFRFLSDDDEEETKPSDQIICAIANREPSH
ncbi:membrane protein required for colicin V production [Breznakibacter xylanolyticus]|uniref:Membrane protein required for colicin V production n=1 Tax=Breznakibacter xylanolyticus TaxID=990 RepID=A0A2W7N6X4_9BACT|nr:CvpA family protein [Breznakibacter xylanolyticus]MBN2743114.1 CvpA family protein [Marinilabiliaceae bacterium]PZX15861.1 membrane protein required for colicin V production [Breznakibacter xylanolyticus]